MRGARAGPETLRQLLHRGTAPSGCPVQGRVLLPRPMTLSRGVDGVWWPRCRDLRAELPTVLPALGVRLQTLQTIHFCTADWNIGGHEICTRDAAPVALRHLATPGLIVFTGPRLAVIFGLISPDSDTAAATEATAHFFAV